MPSIQVLKGHFDEQEGIRADFPVLDSLPQPDQMMQLSVLCRSALETAEQKGVSVLLFPSIPPAEKNSVMFQAISILYKTMRDFQRTHSLPEEIRIICEDDAIFELYMAVWNLYYAENKTSRMNDGRWD